MLHFSLAFTLHIQKLTVVAFFKFEIRPSSQAHYITIGYNKFWTSTFFHKIILLSPIEIDVLQEIKVLQSFWKKTSENAVTMVFCYQNCSDLLWEKIVLVIEKNFWNSRLKAENLQNFWDHWNNLFKQWKVRRIFGI